MDKENSAINACNRPLVIGVDIKEAPPHSKRKLVGDREICWSENLWAKSQQIKERNMTAHALTPIRKGRDSKPAADVEAEIASLANEYAAVQQEVEELRKLFDERELASHMTLLHEYNEIKDAGQILLGKLAEIRATTTKSLYREFDLELDD